MYLFTTTGTGTWHQLLSLAAVQGVAMSWDSSGLKVLIGPSPSAIAPSSTKVQSERRNLLLTFWRFKASLLIQESNLSTKLKNDKQLLQYWQTYTILVLYDVQIKITLKSSVQP